MSAVVVFRGVADHLPPPDAADRKIATKTVFASPDGRVVNLALAEGATLADHSSPHPILVQVLSGEVEFTWAQESTRLVAGGLVSVDAGVVHAVHAFAPSSLLITLLL